ncbi:MAG: hypothetical protein ACR2JM_14370 [Mycobacterium sp.]
MGGILAGASEEREALTLRLRSLAAELDGIDREIADRQWLRERGSTTATTDLENRRAKLTAQLRSLAGKLRHLDDHRFSA